MPVLTGVAGSTLLLFTVDLLGSQAIQALLANLANLKGQRLKDAWEEMAELVAREARDKAPEWQGTLQAGIDREIIVAGDDITAVIFSDEPYAPFQERGTEPYWPNIDALEPWAADKGYSAFAVARAIATRGLPALKFFEKTLIEHEDEIVGMVGQVITEIMEKEY